MQRVSISGGRQAAELPFRLQMPAVHNPLAVAPASEKRGIAGDDGGAAIAKAGSFADCRSRCGGRDAGALAGALCGEGPRAGYLQAVGDAVERDEGWSARDSCRGRRRGVGERDERDGSADRGQRVHVAELRDASWSGEAGFSGYLGLGCEYGDRDVVGTGGSVAALQDHGWVFALDAAFYESG